jgi:glycosyltransferase involved in cell wall biosynthesis
VSNHSVAVVGVLYPGVEPYLNAYLRALEQQTFNRFDLVLANDGLSDAESYLQNVRLKVVLHTASGSIAAIRRDLIETVVRAGYDFIVFTDCDDYISCNRLEVCNRLLGRSAIVVNDLDVVSEDGKIQQLCYFSHRLNEGALLDRSDLLNGNLMGLTNVAARSEVLLRCILRIDVDVDVIAFDWLLWTYALEEYEAEFTATTSTQYRVYSGNIAGLPQSIDQSTVVRGLSIKVAHYAGLKLREKIYDNLYDVFSRAKAMSADSVWLNRYVSALRREQLEYPMWWENIKSPGEVGVL